VQQESGIGNEFVKDLCNAMAATDIPWYKLQVPKFRPFFEKYCKRQVPDETTLLKDYLHACYQETIVNIRKESYLLAAVDETTDALGRFVAKLIVGRPRSPLQIISDFCQSAGTHESFNSCTWTEM
jgi:hypothetical protein